jgi:uncharacterized protein (TIGR02145 family)
MKTKRKLLFAVTLFCIGLTGLKAQTVKDIDGNTYKTVKIGEQIWMAENLYTTKYNDSTDIPLVTDKTSWNNLSTPGYCWYKNDAPTYKNTYGALYNWYTVNTNKLCPTGWHVPTDAEWISLTDYLGGENVAGGKLKESGTKHWLSPNTGATNEIGFTALPGGRRHDGTFNLIGYYGYWWSSTEYSIQTIAFYRSVSRNKEGVYYGNWNKKAGFCVRCMKD